MAFESIPPETCIVCDEKANKQISFESGTVHVCNRHYASYNKRNESRLVKTLDMYLKIMFGTKKEDYQ